MFKPLLWAGLGLGVVLSACSSPAPVVARSSGSIGIRQDDVVLYVVDADHDTLNLIDAQSGTLLRQTNVGKSPERVLVAPDGAVYVTNKGDRTVMRLSADGAVEAVGATGAEPVGMTLTNDGQRLVVANSRSGTLTVLDAATLKPVDQLTVGGAPWAVTAHADGRRLYVTDFSGGGVNVVDLQSRAVERQVLLAQPATAECAWGATQARTPAQPADVVLSPDGERVYVAHVQSRTGFDTGTQQSLALAVAPALATLTTQDDALQPEPSWGEHSDFPAAYLATNLDEGCRVAGTAPGMDAPSSLVVDGRGEWIFVADHNSNAIAVVSAVRAQMDGMRDPSRGIYDVVRVGARPTGIAVSSDLRTAYVHNALDYSISVVTNEGGRLSERKTLYFASSTLPAAVERGRRLFYSAVDPRVTQPELGGVSCSSCHPNGGTDGLNWVLPDPDGVDIWTPPVARPSRNTPALWGVTGTAPYHWDGLFADLPAFSSHMVSQMGGGGLGGTDVADLTAYLSTVSPPDNPNAAADAALLARGEALFTERCATCHAGALLTDRLAHEAWGTDVGALDTPSLLGAFATQPYLHTGGAHTVKDVLRAGPFAIAAHDQTALPGADLDALSAFVNSR